MKVLMLTKRADHLAYRQVVLWLGHVPSQRLRVSRRVAPLLRVHQADLHYRVTQKVVAGVYPGITTVELDVRYLFITFFLARANSNPEPCRRDRRVLDHQTPRLCSPRCSNRHLQSSQGDEEELLPGDQRSIPLQCVQSPQFLPCT